MENRINIAEILKNCPRGMELNCVMYEDCRFLDVDSNNDSYLIRITTPYGIKYLDKYGCYTTGNKAKCIIFPKGKTTWEGFVHPCKFKVEKGKWYVCTKDLFDNYANKAFCKGSTYLSTQDGSLIPSNSNVPFEVACASEYFRDWTINDAKDGDVLAFYSEYKGNKMVQVGIVKEYVGKHGGCSNTLKIYVGVDWDNNLQIGEYMGCPNIYPATKEQRNLLFKKIKEAGYKWNTETKTLERLIEPKFKIGDRIKSIGSDKHYIVKNIELDRYILNDNTFLKFNDEHIFELASNKVVELKFHVGDWIVNRFGDVWRVDSFDSKYYHVSNGNNYCYFLIEEQDEMRRWTIDDAKDGDVLAINWHKGNDSWEKVVIFKKHHNKGIEGLISSPCVEGYGNTFKNGKLAFHDEVPYFSRTWTACLHPASKEQRDLLFTKMKEADSEWDFEKKELKKIEPKFHEGNWIVFNGLTLYIKEVVKGFYRTISKDGVFNSYNWSIDNIARLWTTQDAKDGDVLVCDINKSEIGGDVEKLPNIVSTIFIFKKVITSRDYTHSYCHLYNRHFLGLQNTIYYNSFVYNIRPATKVQCDLLFQEIKEAGYKWVEGTKTLEKLIILKFKVGDRIKGKYTNNIYTISSITPTEYNLTNGQSFTFDDEDCYELVPNKFDVSTLEPYDKVLVRLAKDGIWHATFFSHYDKEVKWGCYPFVTTSSKSYSMCIPYKGNEHLRGTKNDCDEFYKTWE